LKEESLDCTQWRIRFGPVIRQTTKRINYGLETALLTSLREFNNCPTRCDLFSLLYFCRQLYMFRVLTPIFRSTYNFRQNSNITYITYIYVVTYFIFCYTHLKILLLTIRHYFTHHICQG